MNRAKEAEWLQKLILLGIGLLIGNIENILGLPYDSPLKHVIEAVSMQYQQSTPFVLLILIAFYVGLETVTKDHYIERVVFTESKSRDHEA